MTTMTTETATVEVGSIFYTSWGYDQTNVDFYEVIAMSKSGKTATVVEIAARYDEERRGVVAVPGAHQGEPQTKRIRVRGKDTSFHVASYATAWLWDGQAKYDTLASGGMGH